MPELQLNPLEKQYFEDALRYALEHEERPLHERLMDAERTFLSLLNLISTRHNRRLFSGWVAKIHYVAQAYGLPQAQRDRLRRLRYLLLRESHKPESTLAEGLLRGTSHETALLLQKFSDTPVAEVLFFPEEEILLTEQEAEPDTAQLEGLFLGAEKLPNLSGNRERCRTHWLTEAFGEVEILLEDQHIERPDGGRIKLPLAGQVKFLLENKNSARILNLKKVDEKTWASTDHTLLILEPDYLINASDIRAGFTEKESNPFLILLGRITFFAGNEATFAGNIVNDILDNMLREPEISFEEAYTEALAGHRIEAAVLEPLQVEEIKKGLHNQFNNLKRNIEQLSPSACVTEPSFLSTQYGLQGRLDVLVEHESEEGDARVRRDIFELKSSKRLPWGKGWAQDLAQVACYNLMIDSTFTNRYGVSGLIYSVDPQRPVRDCGPMEIMQRRVLILRNRLVALDWHLAQGDRRVVEHLPARIMQSELPPYKRQDARIFQNAWTQAKPLVQDFFVEFMGLVLRELLQAKVGNNSGQDLRGGFNTLWRLSANEKKHDFLLLDGLSASDFSVKTGEVTFTRDTASQDASAFRQGDMIVLYPQEDGPLAQQILKGSIAQLQPEKMIVKLWNKQLPENYFSGNKKWAVEPNLLEKNHHHLQASLYQFLQVSYEKMALYMGLLPPRFQEGFHVDYTARGLSENQNDVLNRALAAKDYFLLQGPPGTGKTSGMLRNLVHYLYHETQETVVLLAFTNRATDEICEKVNEVTQGNFIKLGNAEEGTTYYPQCLKSAKDTGEIRKRLAHTRVFVSTIASYFSNQHLVRQKGVVIVDEASQLLEPHLCGIVTAFKRFILIGDERQLPAVLTQQKELAVAQSESLKAAGFEDLSLSVFERLLRRAKRNNWARAYAMLEVQYRTHQDVAGFISKEFYRTLRPGSERQHAVWETFAKLASTSPRAAQLHRSRVVYIPSPSASSIKYHLGEVEIVIEILQLIQKAYGESFNDNTVGVITPYRAQIAEIRKRLPADLAERVTVDTVERYQGSERDIILYSLAVTSPGMMEHLQAFDPEETVDKKLNVALSRAREQIVLIGQKNMLQHGKFYKKFLAYAKNRS